MSTLHDIYDPPPAPVPWSPPKGEPLKVAPGDLAWLGGLAGVVVLMSSWAWSIEPTLGPWVSLATAFVVIESWFSALTFLHRHPNDRTLGRWMIFLAALMPWLLALGSGVGLMVGLFYLSDWLR